MFASSVAPEPPEIDGYRVLSKLGEGGAAVVYEAEVTDRDKSPDDQRPNVVALKVLKPEVLALQNVVASFQYETRVISRLDHPGILRVFESGAQNGEVYAAIELVDGKPLETHLIRHQKLKPPQAVDFGMQILEALEHLHERGYVHRDLKPGNLMLAGDGRLVLMDFGTVVKANAKIDYEDGIYGTAAYLSPEQVKQDSRIDGRADLYAASVLLYRMLTGRRPFQGLRDDLLAAHLHDEPEQPSRHALISPELDALILKGLSKSPDDRHQSASEMLAELRLIADSGSASKSAMPRRLFAWARKS